MITSNLRISFRKIIGQSLFILCLFVPFVSAIAYPEGIERENNNSSISSDLINWNQNRKIPLLDHQLIPIDYLEKHNDIKGLLVYHYLGTGKTFLSLGLAERHQAKNVVILVPHFLVSHWQKNIDVYAVQNRHRYKIVTHENPEALISSDLTNSILIIDESHRLINKLSSANYSDAELYSKLYLNLRNAYKILSLTGTPIHGDIIDAAYQINLVSGKDLLPFNSTQFRKDFSLVSQGKAMIRGHIVESQQFPFFLSYAGISLAPLMPQNFGLLASVAMLPVPYLIRNYWPIDQYSLRHFDAYKLREYCAKYITYYDFRDKKTTDYPNKTIYYKDLGYSEYQISLLMRFADSLLTTPEIMILHKDDFRCPDAEYISLNSSRIQEDMKKRIGNAREIGNLIFKDDNGKPIFPEKFKKILDTIKSSKGPVVLYSHFYHNGLFSFKRYLDFAGYNGQYALLEPSLPHYEYESIISKYNNGQIKILMLHPDITEGISLKGTAQLHILEPSVNKSAQDQIIGRVVRYKSHTHLPANERNVSIYIWKQTFGFSDMNHMVALRKNWHKMFPELNYYSARMMIDKNANIKLRSPDDHAHDAMNALDDNTKSLVRQLQNFSIENTYKSR